MKKFSIVFLVILVISSLIFLKYRNTSVYGYPDFGGELNYMSDPTSGGAYANYTQQAGLGFIISYKEEKLGYKEQDFIIYDTSETDYYEFHAPNEEGTNLQRSYQMQAVIFTTEDGINYTAGLQDLETGEPIYYSVDELEEHYDVEVPDPSFCFDVADTLVQYIYSDLSYGGYTCYNDEFEFTQLYDSNGELYHEARVLY